MDEELTRLRTLGARCAQLAAASQRARSERDALVVALWRRGAGRVRLASIGNMSRSRVDQVIRDADRATGNRDSA